MAEGDTWVNALIGGVVTLVTGGFVPFAPVLGGAIAGYLDGGTREDGLRVGAFAGLIALIPFVLLMFFISSFLGAIGFGFGMMGGGPRMFGLGAGIGAVFILFILIFAAVYVVGLSAVGGWLGNYIKYDTNIDV